MVKTTFGKLKINPSGRQDDQSFFKKVRTFAIATLLSEISVFSVNSGFVSFIVEKFYSQIFNQNKVF